MIAQSTQRSERARAAELLLQYGRSGLNYFKLWPDKSYFFSTSGNCFLAYGVAGHTALVLGDPVGPEAEIQTAITEFVAFCQRNIWHLGFHQNPSDFLPIYERLGFRKLKIGDVAIVDLSQFTLAGKAGQNLRKSINKLERSGMHIAIYEPPIPNDILAEARMISDEWLQPNRRERTFTVGQFEPGYVRYTPLFTALDQNDQILAFVNLIPSYRPGEATADLMRRRAEAPNDIMNYLFVKLFDHSRRQGYHRFNLGLAPMSGFQLDELASGEEKAIHAFFQRLNFLFSFSGLRQYKAEFATTWEPRYLIYRSQMDSPRLGFALNQLSEVAGQRQRWLMRKQAIRFKSVTLELMAKIGKLRGYPVRSSE